MSQSDIVAPLEPAYALHKEKPTLITGKRMATLFPEHKKSRTHHRPLSTRTEVTVEVAALMLNSEQATVRRLIARDVLPARKKRGIWLINREGLRTYHEAQQAASGESGQER